MAGATTAYSGKNSMVNTKDPGIARVKRKNHEKSEDHLDAPATVYLVQRLQGELN